MDYRAARDYAHNLRLRIYGKTRTEITREAADRETGLLQELVRSGNALSEERAKVRQLDHNLYIASSQLRSKDAELLELRERCSILRSAAAAKDREASDARAAQAFSGFLSTELQSQVQIQRQMMAQTDKAFEALVNADITTRDRPSPLICKCAPGAGQTGGTIPNGTGAMAGCTPGDTPKGRRCCGAHRKAGKNAGTARRVRNKA